ncbi:sarcolemmal membrane-associated protein [Trichonephila clavipes]|nr:sarcolemmal membrane-associated protein [Trichonephila clavipes]
MEALHREQILEIKLGTLQKVVANTQDESDIGWKALIEEDRLLSRIETLESQLQTCGKNVTEEKLKDDVIKLQEDKDKYQLAAKESLRKILQEKLEAIRKVQELENSLSNTENESSHLLEANEKKEQEILLLLEKATEHEKEISSLTKNDEAHFWLNGYINKQNCRIWSEANPQVYVKTPLHPEKLTVWAAALWAGGILLQKR